VMGLTLTQSRDESECTLVLSCTVVGTVRLMSHDCVENDRRVSARVTAHRTAVTEKAVGEGSGGPAR
jgi:hypothetical protein